MWHAGRRVPPFGKAFWLLWTASTVSTLGDGIRYVVFPMLAATITRDPAAVAIVSAAGFLPWPVFGLLGGAVADRVDRRQLMWRIDVFRGLFIGLFAVLVTTQSTSIAMLAAVSFTLGVAGTFFDNATTAMTPMLVGEHDIERANSWLFSSATTMATLVGAPVGGALFAVSTGLPLFVDAVSFIAAAMLVATIRGKYKVRASSADTTVMRDIGVGMRWLWQQPVLRTLCLLFGVVSGCFAAAESVLVLYALDVLHIGTLGYSLLLTAAAVGGLVGALAAPKVRSQLGLRGAIALSLFSESAAVALAGVTTDVLFAVPLLATVGATSMLWNVITMSLLQRLVPAELLGRVTATYRIIGFSALPLGAAAGGFLAKSYGLHAPYLIAGTVLACSTIVGLPFIKSTPPATVPEEPISRIGVDWRVFR
jgi:MFS family permease